MAISEVDLGDEGAFHDWYAAVQEVWVDAWPGDPPWAEEAEMRNLFSDHEYNRRVLFVGRTESGDVAGAAEIGMPQRDNVRVANVEIGVRPSFRRSGIGRALLEHAEEFALAHGRTILLSSTFGRQATLESRDARFATSAGYVHARSEVRRELRLPLEVALVDALELENIGASTDYEFVSWWRHCPEELVESRARLATTLTADEPHGDLEVETERYDVERVRRWERDLENVGRELACTGAVSRATGELAAVTEIGMPRPGEDLGMQFATVVAREHRGHRLGILVKLANLRLITGHASRPTRICTWNAESNDHMIRVNEEIGFQIAGRAFNWQKTGG
jgi:GNAT superfamily N-acetyltransferase